MNRAKMPKKYKLQAAAVFLVVFLLFNGAMHLQVMHHKTEEQLKATYTAESTVRRVESQLNRYLAKSDLLKKTIEHGYTISNEEFMRVAMLMLDTNDALQCIELAKDGVVTQLYPLNQSEVIGHSMFDDTERGACARKARDSGEYTIAGPFELIQGGTGALLFDPIYTTGTDEKQSFWGFSILVIDWDKFIEELQLNKLEEADYHYQIWKKSSLTGEQMTIAAGQNTRLTDALEVVCEVPNDQWYFEIVPKEGWYSSVQMIGIGILCALFALLVAMLYWLFAVRRYKDAMYAREIKRSAEAERAANAAKTSFLSRMSHDIRTPLNGIIGLLKIDEKHADDRALIESNRKKMMVAANHLLALINDVLQMSKLESGEMTLAHEIVDLTELSRDVLTIVGQRAADAGVTMEYNSMEMSKIIHQYVYGSPLHLRQVFLNIYSNAIKYNRIGGKVYTAFDCLGDDGKMVTYRWTISDTGVGMTSDFLKHIFEPFAQEHTDARSVYSGTGLGMAIVKTLIDKMNGTISVESREGEGSAFTITLPMEIAQKDQAVHQSEENGDIRGLHLLLAEDNELNAEIAETLLRDEGAQVTIVRDGEQAIKTFSAEPAGTFDAILMDIMMPKVDGLSATRTIRGMERSDAKTIPIIAMTANAYAEDAQRCLAAGMNAHLAKPLQMEKVVQTISKYCKK